MSPAHYRVAELLMPTRRLLIDRVEGYGLSGGWYSIAVGIGTPTAINTIRVNLKDLIRLRDDLSREIDSAARDSG